MGEEKILGEGESAGGEDVQKEEGSTILTGDAKPEEDEKSDDKNDDDAGEEKAGEKETADKDGDADDKSKDSDADKDVAGAPDEYEQFDVPEGVDINPEVLTEFTSLLKDANVSQAQAQSFVDLQLKMNSQAAEAQAQQWADIQGEWQEAGENDEEYGKGKYDESVMIARKAMRTVGSPALGKALEETGMGNHPEFIRFFYRVGVAIGEDSLSFGGTGKGADKTAAEKIFPNQGKG